MLFNWRDENFSQRRQPNPMRGGGGATSNYKEPSPSASSQQDCRFIPFRKETNSTFSQYLLKENVNTSNQIPGNSGWTSEAQNQAAWQSSSQSQQFYETGSQMLTSNNHVNSQQSSSSSSQSSHQSYASSSEQNQYGYHPFSGSSTSAGSGSVTSLGMSSYSRFMGESLFSQELKKNRVLRFQKESDEGCSSSIDGGMMVEGNPFQRTLAGAGSRGLLASEYGGVQKQQLLLSQQQLESRVISGIPERILDAPLLNDDYYLNLMDWSDCGDSSGTLAIALGSEVYLWNERDARSLFKTENDFDYVSCVSWMGSTSKSSTSSESSIMGSYYTSSQQQKKSCLAIGLSDATIQLWDAEKCMPYRVLKGHQGRVSSMSWNGCILSSGSADAQILNHDIRVKEHVVSRFLGHEQEVCGLKWSPDGTQLASGSNDNTLRIWELSGISNSNNNNNSRQNAISAERACFRQHRAAVKAIAWCPWSKGLLASGGGTKDKTIKFWNTNVDRMELVNSIDCGSQVCALLWNPNAKELVSSHGFQDNQLVVWSYPTMRKITELYGHSNRVLHLALAPDAKMVCSASSDETLRFWNVFSGNSSERLSQSDSDSHYFTKSHLNSHTTFAQNLFIR